MDVISNTLWLNELTTQRQVEQLLSAEEQNTPDKAALRIGALKAITKLQSTHGKWAFSGGIVLAILGVPLMLLIIGFPMFAIGLWMLWLGRRQWRNADTRGVLLDSGLAAHVDRLSTGT